MDFIDAATLVLLVTVGMLFLSGAWAEIGLWIARHLIQRGGILAIIGRAIFFMVWGIFAAIAAWFLIFVFVPWLRMQWVRNL